VQLRHSGTRRLAVSFAMCAPPGRLTQSPGSCPRATASTLKPTTVVACGPGPQDGRGPRAVAGGQQLGRCCFGAPAPHTHAAGSQNHEPDGGCGVTHAEARRLSQGEKPQSEGLRWSRLTRNVASLRMEGTASLSGLFMPTCRSSPGNTLRRAGRASLAAPHFGSAPAALRDSKEAFTSAEKSSFCGGGRTARAGAG
jgi:hypothetical protein